MQRPFVTCNIHLLNNILSLETRNYYFLGLLSVNPTNAFLTFYQPA
jgi:hypothetical protein